MKRLLPLLAVLGLTHVGTAQRVVPYGYQGTVQAVRRAGDVDLLTGVGEALRVLHLRVVPATQIISGGRPGTVADVLPGDLIRVECHGTFPSLVADRIEKLGRIDALGPPNASRP